MIIYNKLDNHFVVSADRQTFLGFEMTANLRDTSFNNISNTRHSVHHISNTEKRVENTTRSGVFLTNCEGFDTVMKYCDECLI